MNFIEIKENWVDARATGIGQYPDRVYSAESEGTNRDAVMRAAQRLAAAVFDDQGGLVELSLEVIGDEGIVGTVRVALGYTPVAVAA